MASIPDYQSDEFPCDHIVAGSNNEPIPWCDDGVHAEAEIISRWQAGLNGGAEHYTGETKAEQIKQWKVRIGRLGHEILKADPAYHKAHLVLADVVAPLQQEIFASVKSSLFDTRYAVYKAPDWLAEDETWTMIANACEAAWELFRQADRNALLIQNGKIGEALNDLPSPPKSKPTHGIMSVKEYLTMFAERASRPAIWEETLYAGAFNMLVGRPFTGKSSFAASLLRSIVLAEAFMGRPCKTVLAAYLALERNGVVVAKLFDAWGLSDKVFFADEIPAQDAAEFIEREVRRLSLGFVVIDHLQHSTKIKESSSYSEVSNALMPYQTIAKVTGCCILGLHHQTKPQGENKVIQPADEDPIEVMGSDAYRGASDTLIETTTVRGQYFIRAHTRTGNDIGRMRIEIDFETGVLTARSPESAEIERTIEKIKDFLFRAGTPLTEAEIREGIEGKTKTLAVALRNAVRQGAVIRRGQGGRLDPFRYSIALDDNGNNQEHEEQERF